MSIRPPDTEAADREWLQIYDIGYSYCCGEITRSLSLRNHSNVTFFEIRIKFKLNYSILFIENKKM